MVREYEAERRRGTEWRAQHREIQVEAEEAKDRKKRPKSEVKKVQETYIGAVTRQMVGAEEEKKKGKFGFGAERLMMPRFADATLTVLDIDLFFRDRARFPD